MLRRLMVLFFVLAILAPVINAQGIGIGPQLGWQKASSADEGRFMYGAALRLKASPAIGIEGSVNYREEEYANGGLKVRTWPIMLTGLFYPIPVAYAGVGVGWYNTTFDYGNELSLENLKNNTQQNFGWHLGGGLEIPIGQTVMLTGDIRYVFLNYDFGDLANRAETGDLESNFYVITVGLLFGINNPK